MVITCRHLILAVVLLGCLATMPAARAQGARPAGAAAEPLAFTVFARNRQAGLQFFPAENAAPQSVEFFGNTRSPVYMHRGGGSVPFYKGAELAAWLQARAVDPRNPPPMPAPVAVAQVPPGMERALFLFIPVKAPAPGEARFYVYVVDDSPRQLPVGYASVINASGREYMAKIGEQVLDVPHGVGGKVPVQGAVELRLAAQSGDGWVVGGRHTFRLGERDRVSLVFFPPTNPTGIAPIIRTLVEEVPGEKTAKPAEQVASAGR